MKESTTGPIYQKESKNAIRRSMGFNKKHREGSKQETYPKSGAEQHDQIFNLKH